MPTAISTRPTTPRRSSVTSGSTAARAVQYPEYDKLFKDGLFPITVGVGYDEGGADRNESRDILAGLRQRGFKSLDVSKMSDAELRQKGIDPALVDKKGMYFVKSFQFRGKPVIALLKFVDRSSPDARERFALGFAQRGLIYYGGHARYGSGPDFDPKESPAGNFVIGTPYDAHMRDIIRGTPNALQQSRLTDDYQLMYFDACSSKNYLDELRSLLPNKDANNLDIIATNGEVPWGTAAHNLFTVIDGVMAGKGTDDMRRALERANNVSLTLDGFDTNAYVA